MPLRRTPLLLVALFWAMGTIPSAAKAQECLAVTEQGDACAAGAAPDVGSAPPASLPRVRLGNPISLVTGTKTQQEIDLALDGAPLGFRRTYSSAASDADIGLGHGWRHTYAVSLYATEDGGRRIVESSGRHVPFAPAGGRFVPELVSDGYLLPTSQGHEWHLPDGRTLSFRGQWLWRIDWRDHRRLTLRYSPAGLASVTDETGRRLRLEWVPGQRGIPVYDGGDAQMPPGHLSALVLPDGKRIGFAYDGRLNLTRARYPDDTLRRYHYENAWWPNHLTGLTERTGTRFATWTYDEAGRATSSEHADGVERVTLGFGASVADGNIGTTVVTDSAGARSVYSYIRHVPSGAALLLSAEGPGCATCPPTGRRYGYDGTRLVATTVLDEAGAFVAMHRRTHDGSGRLLSLVETRTAADGTPVDRLVERREYATGSDAATRTAPRLVARPSIDPSAEHVTETVRDADGLTVAIVERGRTPTFDASGAATGFASIERTLRFEHDEAGRLSAIDGPRDDVDDRTRFEWDDANRLVALLPPASPALHVTRFDASGRPAELRIGTRAPLVMERDADGNVTTVRRGETIVRYEHDPEGRLTAIVDPDGRRTTIDHDAAGRVTSVTDDLGRVDAFVRDGESRIVGRSRLGIDGATLRSVEYLFDASGRLSTSIERGLAADGSAKASVTLAHETDRGGLGRRLTNLDTEIGAGSDIDLLARLTTFTAPDGATTAIEHDAAGRDVALTDARGNTTRYPADDFGRVVLLESPDTGTVRHTVDAAGNRVRTILADGQVVSTRFDAANRPVERTGPDSITSWRYGNADELGAHGLLVEATNPATTERFGYDIEGRLVLHVREIDGHAFETRYTYDGRGRLVAKALPDGQKLVYHYRETGPGRGTLRAITRGRWWGMADDTIVAEIDLDARDERAGWTSGTGVRTEQRFAATGELVGLDIGSALQLAYEFDAAGRIVGIDDGGAAHRYGYAGGRLVSATGPDRQLRYAYDSVGNRTASSRRDADGTTATTHAFPPAGEGSRLLESIDTASRVITAYRYDAAGAPLTSGALSWRYDADRRPVEVRRHGELVATYAYNAFGERVKKVVHSGPGARPRVTYFLYDGRTLTAEADDTGEIVAQYVYLDGHRAVAKLEGKRQYGIHGDHLGTPRVMTDESGDIVWEAEYTPFGEATLLRDDVLLNLRLPGQYADAETGTHYNYFRDYDPATGRYLTSDPIGLAGGVNGYGYVGGSPMAFIDPLGLDRLTLGGELGGLHDIAADALERGTISEQQYQQAMEGLRIVPKPGLQSEFSAKLMHVFARAFDTLSTDPRYTDQRMADLLEGMGEAAPQIAGMVALYSVIAVTQPHLTVVFTAASFGFAGVEAAIFLGDIIAVAIETSGTDACDVQGLNALGDRFAASAYDAGVDAVSGALLGGLGGVASVGRRFAMPGRDPSGSTRQELEAAIEHELNVHAARGDSPIKNDLGVVAGPGRFTDYRPQGQLDVDVQRHVLEGERSGGKNKQMTGGHWAASETVVVDYDTAILGPGGVVKVKIKIYDPSRDRFVIKGSGASKGWSTMFPPSWTPRRILNEAAAASDQVDLSLPGLQSVVSPLGVEIMFRVRDGKIQTFYPAWPTP